MWAYCEYNPVVRGQSQWGGVILWILNTILRSEIKWDCLISRIATVHGLDDGGVGLRVPVGSKIFSAASIRTPGPTQPPLQ
jgi:hypothetical protein